MPYINADITADDVVDLMNEDGNFMKDMFQVIAQRAEMGLLSDNLGDIAGQMKRGEAQHLADRLAGLSQTVRDGHNMANLEQI